MIRICSGFSPTGRLQYGERFLRSFAANMPEDIELQVFAEEQTSMPRKAYRDLWSIEGAREFEERHRENLMVHGRVDNGRWKAKEKAGGYCFRFDAYKFWKQILIPQAASRGMDDGDILIWMDADVEVISRPSALDLVDLLCGAQVCYLNREPKHSEIGFWAVRLDPQTRKFLSDMAKIYTTDQFLDLKEWHSAFVWDVARKSASLNEKSICRRGARGHVWPSTRLAKWFRHDKGDRKPKVAR